MSPERLRNPKVTILLVLKCFFGLFVSWLPNLWKNRRIIVKIYFLRLLIYFRKWWVVLMSCHVFSSRAKIFLWRNMRIKILMLLVENFSCWLLLLFSFFNYEHLTCFNIKFILTIFFILNYYLVSLTSSVSLLLWSKRVSLVSGFLRRLVHKLFFGSSLISWNHLFSLLLLRSQCSVSLSQENFFSRRRNWVLIFLTLFSISLRRKEKSLSSYDFRLYLI